MDCPKFGRAPAQCPTGHQPGIDRFIGDQIAMRNAAAGFKSELKVTYSARFPIHKLLANSSQANCDWGISITLDCFSFLVLHYTTNYMYTVYMTNRATSRHIAWVERVSVSCEFAFTCVICFPRNFIYFSSDRGTLLKSFDVPTLHE